MINDHLQREKNTTDNQSMIIDEKWLITVNKGFVIIDNGLMIIGKISISIERD